MDEVSHPDPMVAIDALERYWTETLTPVPLTAGPPPDYPRTTVASAAAPIEIEIAVPADVSAASLLATDGRPARLCAMLMASCAVVLHRHSGADRLCLLTPVAEPLAGEGGTNRWTVVRTDIDSAQTANELFERVGCSLADAFAHQEFPFARILELAGCTWSAHRAPLSDVAVAFEGVSRTDVFGDVASDLTIVGAMVHGALRVRVAYRGDLFAEDTVRAFGHLVVRVLGAMLDARHARIDDVRLLSAEEEAAAIVQFRARTERSIPARRIEELIRDTARAIPDRAAFIHGSASLSYADLIRRASACAL